MAARAFFLSVNVPPEVLGRGGIYHSALRSRLLEVADQVVLEITERNVIDKLGMQALNMISSGQFKVRVALDDVTLQGANLVILSRLNVHMIKVDAPAIAHQMKALSALIHAANFHVVVECVETAEQVAALQESGVHFAQGRYFAWPLDADRFLEYAKA